MSELTRNTTTNTIGTGTGGLELDPSGSEVVTINNGVVLPMEQNHYLQFV